MDACASSPAAQALCCPPAHALPSGRGLSYFLGHELKEVEEDLEKFYDTEIIV